MVDVPIDKILGPTGALVFSVVVVIALARALWILWKEHLKADADDRAQRDSAFALAQTAVDGIKRMAEAWEERNRRDRERGRRDDDQ